jgi:hypothetical protein
VPDGDQWSFTQFGSQLIACNFNDDPQVLDVDTAAVAFTALGGSPPKARIVRATQSFVRLVGMPTDPYGDRWSDLEDAAQWTAGAGTYGLSDRQYFPKGGRVMNVAGGYPRLCVPGAGGPGIPIPARLAIRLAIYGSGGSPRLRRSLLRRFSRLDLFLHRRGRLLLHRRAGGPQAHWSHAGQQLVAGQYGCQSRLASVMAIADPVAPRIYWVGYSTSASRPTMSGWSMTGNSTSGPNSAPRRKSSPLSPRPARALRI